jgi:hypothetical protein
MKTLILLATGPAPDNDDLLPKYPPFQKTVSRLSRNKRITNGTRFTPTEAAEYTEETLKD